MQCAPRAVGVGETTGEELLRMFGALRHCHKHAVDSERRSFHASQNDASKMIDGLQDVWNELPPPHPVNKKISRFFKNLEIKR